MTLSVSGDSITFPDLSTQLTAPKVGMVNRIINGDMRIDQRNASASVTPTTAVYIVDRWRLDVSQASKFSAQQNAGAVTPPTGFSNYLGATSLSAYSIGAGDYFTWNQPIEGFNFADLAWGTASASTITLSFWVRSSLTGTFGGALQNSATTYSYPFTYSIPVANTWTQISITVAGPTAGTWVGATNGMGLNIYFGLGVGSGYSGTAGSWASANYKGATGATSVVGTSGATFYITGVQLEKGSTATAFDYLDYGRSLIQCQRYFLKDLQDAANSLFLVGLVISATVARCGVRFPVNMRVPPTATIGGTTNARIYDGTAAPVLTSISNNVSNTFGANLDLTASAGGLTVGRAGIIIDNNANASFFAYSAEL